jgi:poly(3-hydroxybutyrate) depolymerase
MPLVIFLHGTGEVGNANAVNNLPQVKYMREYGGSTPPFISIAPVGNSAKAWPTSTVKSIVDSVAKEYESDPDRIYIWGFSLGGIGTWQTVNAYPGFFAAAIPISGCQGNAKAANFVNTPILAISGTVGVEGQTYGPCMKNFVNQINNSGGSAQKETYSGQSHTTLSKALRYSELFSWLLSK